MFEMESKFYWINNSSENQSSPYQVEKTMVLKVIGTYFVSLLLIVYVVLLVCGIILNALVVYVMLRSGKIRKNVSSFLIFHLSLTHVFLYVIFPILRTLIRVESPPILSCTAEEFAQNMFCASIFGSLTAIAWDRYRNVLQPFKSLAPQQLRTYLLLISSIWLYACVSSITVIFTVQPRPGQICWEGKNATEHCENVFLCNSLADGRLAKTIYFVSAFLVPFILMVIIYTKIAQRLWKGTKNGMIHGAVAKHKAKTVRLMVIAVFIFAVGWGFPLCVDFLRVYDQIFVHLSFFQEYSLYAGCKVAEALSSCLNPLVYAFFSPDFRKLCVKFSCCCFRYCLPCLRHSSFRFNSVRPAVQ